MRPKPKIHFNFFRGFHRINRGSKKSMKNKSLTSSVSSTTSSTAWSDFHNMLYTYAFQVLGFLTFFKNVVILIVARGLEDLSKAVPVHVPIFISPWHTLTLGIYCLITSSSTVLCIKFDNYKHSPLVKLNYNYLLNSLNTKLKERF